MDSNNKLPTFDYSDHNDFKTWDSIIIKYLKFVLIICLYSSLSLVVACSLWSPNADDKLSSCKKFKIASWRKYELYNIILWLKSKSADDIINIIISQCKNEKKIRRAVLKTT